MFTFDPSSTDFDGNGQIQLSATAGGQLTYLSNRDAVSVDDIGGVQGSGTWQDEINGADELRLDSASAVALRRLQQHWLPTAGPDRRVLGVMVPMVESITHVPWQVQAPPSGRPTPPAVVGVFATTRTVATGAYPFEIGRRAPAVQVVQQACPDLVAAIEANERGGAIQALVDGYAADLLARAPERRLDSVVLGCTHYPLAADAFVAPRALP